MKKTLIKYFAILFFVIFLFSGLENIEAQTLFEINDFKVHSNDIKLLGSSELNGNILRLTSNKENQAGACWYEAQQIDLKNGFYMDFEFRISGGGPGGGGDGIAFVIQNQGVNQLGASGRSLGYKDLKDAVAISIETFSEGGSRDNVRLSIYDKQSGAYVPYATVHEIPEVNDGNSHYARIEYQNQKIVFYLDSYIFPILTVEVDIDGIVSPENGLAWVGFTSATSRAKANHDILSWSLSQYNEAPELNFSNIDINQEKTIYVRSRKLEIQVWDDDIVDGDTISLKVGNDWLLTEYGVVKKPIKLFYTLRGFETNLTLYAHNYGMVPPNTAAILIDDGVKPHKLKLTSLLNSAESVSIKYKAPDLKQGTEDR